MCEILILIYFLDRRQFIRSHYILNIHIINVAILSYPSFSTHSTYFFNYMYMPTTNKIKAYGYLRCGPTKFCGFQ